MKVALLIFGILLIIIVFFKYKNTINQQNKLIDLYSINIYGLNGVIIDFEQRNKLKPSAVLLFSSDCDVCQIELKTLGNDLSLFEYTNFFLVSNQPAITIKQYLKTLNLPKNVVIGKDTLQSFSQNLKITTIPYLLLYDSEGTLQYQQKGLTNIKLLKEKIKKLAK